jgi:uncharacterized protein
MRKSEREIRDRSVIDALIRNSRVFRLGLTDGNEPYVVPLCFGYDGRALYFHCAPDGRKIELLRRNNKVCFEFDQMDGIVENEQACGWGLRFQSVIGVGRAIFLEKPEEKREALALLMKQYSPRAFTFPDDILSHTTVIKIEIESISGKHGRLS